MSMVGRWLNSVGASLTTRYVLSRRGRYTKAIVPFVGDTLTYEAHGEGIRGEIEHSIDEAQKREPNGKIVLLGHSLGGIACVDLLAMSAQRRSQVVKLITVGSQAPLLFEMNALKGCPNRRPLPAGFPDWLNVFDRRDFLSYIAEKIFKGKGPKSVTDVPVDSRQPFPESHSAYWTNPDTWTAIGAFLP
jgi:pimeloyl-ACP methyl ester carboxylesterase